MSAPEAAPREERRHDERATSAGVRVRLTVTDPPACPVSNALPAGVTATDLSRSGAAETPVEQFRTDGRLDDDGEPVFAAGDEYVHRRDLPEGDCPCRAIEALGHPVHDVRVRGDPPRISLTLLLPSVEPLSEVIDRLESLGASVSLDRLTRTGDGDRSDPIVVDRATLTDRQREVLRTAHRMGYFSYPREASAAEVADAIGIARSTFSEHLAAAHQQVIGDVVDG